MTDEAFRAWAQSRLLRPAPAFSGGVIDEWPAWAVDAFAILDAEFNRIESHVRSALQERPVGDG